MNLSISRILPAIHYEQGVKWGIKKSIRHTLTGIPAHQSLHPIVNSGLETNKTQRHATYFRERSKWLNWQMIQPTARLWVHISAGRGRCQLLIVTKAIDCDLWAPTFRDSCKLCAVAQYGNTPLNIYLNTGCWYSSSVHPLYDTVHAPARRPALASQGSSLTPLLPSHSMTDTWKSHFSEISQIFSFGVTDTSVVGWAI